MKSKAQNGAQQLLPLSQPRDTKGSVIDGRFNQTSKHLDSVHKRLSSSGVFAPRKVPSK